MKEPVKNIAASVLARLKNQAEVQGRPFSEILQYYAMERFLFRLSKTKYAGKFILKGGLLFHVWDIPLRRSTKDIDFRAYVPNNRENLLQILNEVIADDLPEDGIVFDPRSVSVEEIQIDADYQGVRAKMTALLERSKIPVQIDIGFSDEINLTVESVNYPNILSDSKQAYLRIYPKEMAAAEKFHAMVRHAELNSRMKDYYDLWLLSEKFEFESTSLQTAIETTFRKRDTEIPIERPSSLSAEYIRASQSRWMNFLQKMKLENEEVMDLENVIETIWVFIEYPLRASRSQTGLTLKWIPKQGWI